jgi:hypothetical protein
MLYTVGWSVFGPSHLDGPFLPHLSSVKITVAHSRNVFIKFLQPNHVTVNHNQCGMKYW